jgi:integrase
MKVDLPFLVTDVDRHGNVRLYARKKNVGKVRLRAPIGSPTFMPEYEAALQRLSRENQNATAATTKDGTLGWLALKYHADYEFTRLDAREQRVRKQMMEALLDEPLKPGSSLKFRDCPISELTPKHVRVLLKRKQDTPAQSNRRIRNLRIMLNWGLVEHDEYVKRNAASEVKPLKYDSKGFHTWTVEEVKQYEARHPLGSAARLALVLMLYTGMRRQDAITLGPQHVKDGLITFTPIKTSKSTKTVLQLPELAILRAILDGSALGEQTFLVTEYGKPFSSNGFGNWFRKRCNEAGLPRCTSHGLRKAGAVCAAENGATEKQIMAIFGWTSPQIAALYVKKADQKKLAKDAMHLIVPQGVPPGSKLGSHQ